MSLLTVVLVGRKRLPNTRLCANPPSGGSSSIPELPEELRPGTRFTASSPPDVTHAARLDMGCHHLRRDPAERAQETPSCVLRRTVPGRRRGGLRGHPHHPDARRAPADRSARRFCGLDGGRVEGHGRIRRMRLPYARVHERSSHAHRY